MKNFTLISIVLLFFACNSNDRHEELLKENELLKQELELERKGKPTNASLTTVAAFKNEKTNSTISELRKLAPDSNIDVYGNFSIDMGSASSGRVMGNLKEIELDNELLPERPGCADICPETFVIHFFCIENKKCLTDPAFREFTSEKGFISFENIEYGKRFYELLMNIKSNL